MSKSAVRTGLSTVTVRVPLAFPRRGGRKLVVAPDGCIEPSQPRVRIDSTLVKALARAHRWKRLLEIGQYASIADLANAEEINKSYVCRVLRLTLLEPDLIESIIDGRLPSLHLPLLLKPFPVVWTQQHLLRHKS